MDNINKFYSDDEYQIQAKIADRRRQARRAAARKRIMRNRVIALALLAAVILLIIGSCSKTDNDKTPETNTNAAVSSKSRSDESVSEKISVPEEAENTETETEDTSAEEKTTFLYSVDRDTHFYEPADGDNSISGYSSGTIGGLYTGRRSNRFDGYIEIDYKDGCVFISENKALAVSSAKVLPVGVISQFNDLLYGYSACGPACLHMMMNSMTYEPLYPDLKDYNSLMYFAETKGYADQGPLTSENGGMSCKQLQQLARDVYGVDLKNAYSDHTVPSDTLKSLIDGGKQAIVLCRNNNGNISTEGAAHFILVTGYNETDGEIEFLYANSFYNVYVSHGNPLMHISGELLDRSVSADFDEPNTILYATD